MNPNTNKFLGLIAKYLADGVQRQLPENTQLVVNEHNYAYFSHFGRSQHMNTSTAVFLINDDVRGLYVIYQPDTPSAQERRYLVKTLDRNIKVGDYVIVPSAGGHKLTVAMVTDTNAEIDFDGVSHVHWVVQKIDLSAFNTVVKQEEAAVQKIKQADFQRRRRDLVETMMLSTNDLKALPLASKQRARQRR